MKREKPEWWRRRLVMELTCAAILIASLALADLGTIGAYAALFLAVVVVGYMAVALVRR